VQVPGFVPLHVLQVPHDGEPQQTLSTQLPFVHSVPKLQPRPAGLVLIHVVPLQYGVAAAHCASLVQPVKQSVPLQMNGAQFCVEAFGQLPAPSHEAASVCVPFEQVVLRHEIVGYVQERLPAWHDPPQVVPSPAQCVRARCGWPDVTGVHCPSRPERSHARHDSLQGSLQQ
jgi:hypothetical protein